MKKVLKVILIIVIIAGLGVGGYYAFRYYRQKKEAEAFASLQTSPVVRGNLTATVGATGSVRANQSAVLTWQTSGTVENVNVLVGNQVKSEDILANLREDTLAQNVIMARADLANARKALDDLVNSQSPAAQALQALDQAQQALDDLKETTAVQQAQAQLNLVTTQDNYDEMKRRRENLDYARASQATIDAAEARYILAQADVDKFKKMYDQLSELPEDNPRRAAALAKLADAEKKRDVALQQLNWYKGYPDEQEFAQADANLANAQAQLDDAQRAWERIKDGPNPIDVALMEAQLADAKRAYERIKDGPDANDVAALEARIAAAQASLNQVRLKAPFGGTITNVDVLPGDQVSTGKVAFRLDDLSHLLVDVQVSEVDINRIQVGQTVSMTFDAILGKEYLGIVNQVANVGNLVAGVVEFQVTVELTNADLEVKPGMTAAVNIVVEKVKDVLLVPNRAVRIQDNERVVYVKNGDLLEQVKIKLGVSSEAVSQVLDGDLTEGDLIVLNPPLVFEQDGPPGFMMMRR